MIIDNIKTLVNWIVIISLILTLCICVDYAANNDTIENYDNSSALYDLAADNVTFVNGSYVLDNGSGIAKSDGKLYVEKTKTRKRDNVVTITARPSCGCRNGYYWHTTSFVNYCPRCHKYGTLRNVHKYPARHEQELTCSVSKGGCGADYCGVCGKEKYSGSHYHLTKV